MINCNYQNCRIYDLKVHQSLNWSINQSIDQLINQSIKVNKLLHFILHLKLFKGNLHYYNKLTLSRWK